MVLVLTAVATVFVIGMAILNGLPGSTVASRNMVDYTRAVYLAECGLVEAQYRLARPPVKGEIWSGITGRSIDASGGTYDIAVTGLGDDDYRITATGRITTAAGRSYAHTRSLDVRVESTDSVYALGHSLVCGGGSVLPWNLTVDGDAHVNTNAVLMGTVNGKLSASGWVFVWGGKAETIHARAASVDLPSVDLDQYDTYEYQGLTYAARVVAAEDVDDLPASLSPVTKDNPLGVVVIAGDLAPTHTMLIRDGILVVRGQITLNRHDLRVDGRKGFFSLLVEGNVYFSGSGDLQVTNGATYVAGQISSDWYASGMALRCEGGLVAARGLPSSFGGTMHIGNAPLEDEGIDSVQYIGDGLGGDRRVTLLAYHPGSGA